MRNLFCFLLLLFCTVTVPAQKNIIYDTDHIRSLQTICMDDPLHPAIMDRKSWHVVIGFDEMSHEYHRYRYHIEHCEADWTVNEDLFESNYLSGMNDQPIEDYEKSFNTTQNYTHYTLRLPNENTRLLLSGNYRVTVTDEDKDDDPVLVAEFCLADRMVGISAEISGNTDIDFQRNHQQLSLAMSYGALHVTDPDKELKIFVTQNRRPDRTVEIHPNIRKANGLEFNHQKSLIFPGSNECHKFELLDVHRVNMNVDNIRWYDPYYHATLYDVPQQHNYSYDEDANGGYIIRNENNEDNETTCEYAIVHFRFKAPLLNGGDVYVQGNWCNNWPNDDYRMEYDEESGEYHCAVLLKQGYYNYRFVQLTDLLSATDDKVATTERTDGDFFQTENEYIVLVYYKEPSGRYDKLVGYYNSKSKL